jgi:hypothetical protein
MIRVIVLLCSILMGAPAHSETIQQLGRDTSSPSLIDLSKGERGWGEPRREGGAPVTYGGNALLRDSYWGAPRLQFVNGHLRKNGTYVAPYMRSVPRR